MNVTVDVFEDSNRRWVVCFRGPRDWVRLRFTTWQAMWFSAQVRLRKLLGLPLLPYTPPAGVEVEYGLNVGEQDAARTQG